MTWVAVGTAAVSIGTSIMGGMSANKKAKAAADQQAKLTYRGRMEEIRQKRRAADFEKGLGVASVGASNIQMSGSTSSRVSFVKPASRPA